MPKYATGKHSKAISDRSGLEFPYREMVREWNGSLVHFTEFEPKQPQLEPKPSGADAISLRHIRPDRIEPITTVMIPENGFQTYAAGSGIINVFAPGHGLTNGTTYLFRGPPTKSPGTGTPYNPGAQIGQGSGYAVTTGKYIPDTGDGNPGRGTTDYLISNFFFFTVNSDTATTGGIKGGGYGCSVGPITIEG
jgi:hypothetical protein